jgi:hypothetical protein
MTQAIVSATVSGGIAIASRRPVSAASSSGSRVPESVSVNPGDTRGGAQAFRSGDPVQDAAQVDVDHLVQTTVASLRTGVCQAGRFLSDTTRNFEAGPWQ